MDPIDKVSGAGADPLAALARQAQAADALLAMKSDTQPPPQSDSTKVPTGQPQDSIELSRDAPQQLNADLLSALATANLPQLPADVPRQIADVLQRILANMPLPTRPAASSSSAQPHESGAHAPLVSREGFESPDARDFSTRLQTVQPERVERPAQTEQSEQFSKSPQPKNQNSNDSAAPRENSAIETSSSQTKPASNPVTSQSKTTSLAQEALGPERSPIAKTDATNVLVTSTRQAQTALQAMATQARAIDNAPPITLAAGWFTVASNPTTLAYLEVQRDGSDSNTPEAAASAQPHFISLDIYTTHVGVVHVRLSLLKSELVGTLSFAAPAWAAEANQALPELVSGLASNEFRAADLHAIEATP